MKNSQERALGSSARTDNECVSYMSIELTVYRRRKECTLWIRLKRALDSFGTIMQKAFKIVRALRKGMHIYLNEEERGEGEEKQERNELFILSSTGTSNESTLCEMCRNHECKLKVNREYNYKNNQKRLIILFFPFPFRSSAGVVKMKSINSGCDDSHFEYSTVAT